MRAGSIRSTNFQSRLLENLRFIKKRPEKARALWNCFIFSDF
jgi:hypothetical protein